MRKMTEENLKSAFAGESQAHMRYLIFADKAELEKKNNVARLFRSIAHAEQIHASNHFRTLEGIHPTAENLEAAIGGETFEVEEMYPAYKSVADLQEEKGAQRSITWAFETEKVHIELYRRAKEAIALGEDLRIGDIYICGACGFTLEGQLPDKCPLCGASSSRFSKF